ncbi:MAG: ATP-binding protein [Anaerolineae bacterium]|nr:ATP-binding protein [Anaerolineae bacterium]MDQ7033467.1 ATP-binding protein [Anaerolineae bacterium]
MSTEQTNLVNQNIQLHQEIQRRVEQISAINRVAATIGNALDLSVTLDTALEAVTSVVGAEAAGISLIDEEANEVVLRAQLGWLNDFVVDNPMRIPLGKGMSGQVINNDAVVIHHALTGEEDYAVPSFRKETFRSIAMAPMHARGKIIGILSIMSHHANQFDDAVITVLKSIADTVGVAIENARLYEQHVEQENRLNAILHSTADGIIATDQHSRISLVNQAAASMLEVEPEDVMGIPLREADIQIKVRDKLLLALSSSSKDSDKSFHVSLEGGPELSVLVSPVQVYSQVTGESSRDGWVIVLQDITHIRKAEIARVQFIQAAAHDMKNPLGVTQKSIQMLDSMIDNKDETIVEVLGMAKTGVDRVQRLIDDLLNIEKIESGYGFALDDIDVREMCYELSAEIQPLMSEANIQYDMALDDSVPRSVRLDREWMQRAIHNYLENATKYAPHKTVKFAIFPKGENLHFEVTDTGDGIPLRAQSRLFDRFYRVYNRRHVRGSGLGLAIVKSVAEAHHGRAYVHSHEGQGSTFGIMFPLSQD